MQDADREAFKITIHMVSSLDGYIARKDNSITWFETSDTYEKGITVSNKDREEFLNKIDCYIMGSRTYELAVELSRSYGWVYGDIPTIVLTNRALLVERRNIELYSGGLEKLVEERLRPNFNNVWLVGGAKLAGDFIRLKLADEIKQSILPIILGEGTPFYHQIQEEQGLHLTDVRAYKNGMVELSYAIKK